MYTALQMASIRETTEDIARYIVDEYDPDPEVVREAVRDAMKRALRRRPIHPDQWPEVEEAIERGLAGR